MITFDSINKSFPSGTGGLNDVSFQIDDNEFIFLTGPSGAGKTTILKLILGQVRPSSGTVIVNDQNLSDKKFHDVIGLRRTIGVVFQDFKILPEKNAFENVSISLEVLGIAKSTIKQKVIEVLTLVGLDEKKFMFPMQLSAGELQRIAIARAVVGDRKIILADEPTGNLDPKTSWEIMKLFKKLEGDRTLIVATHNVDIVNSYKKRVITLKDGKLFRDQRKGGYEL